MNSSNIPAISPPEGWIVPLPGDALVNGSGLNSVDYWEVPIETRIEFINS
jgi:hypothetical protein